jgi:DNA-binding NarL/FixJ family response regulator
MKHKIIIVDDHILIAKAISSIIENFSNFEVIAECASGIDLQERLKVKKNIPDIVLLDVSMPIMNGFDTAEWLTKNHPQITIMALSMQDDEQSVIKMVKSGAKGYILKNVHPTELEKALTTLVNIGTYYPDWATSKIVTGLGRGQNQTNNIHITEREKEFLGYATSEMSYKEIAEHMICSPRTVESYRDSLFEKLDLKTRVGLAVYALKNGYSN